MINVAKLSHQRRDSLSKANQVAILETYWMKLLPLHYYTIRFDRSLLELPGIANPWAVWIGSDIRTYRNWLGASLHNYRQRVCAQAKITSKTHFNKGECCETKDSGFWKEKLFGFLKNRFQISECTDEIQIQIKRSSECKTSWLAVQKVSNLF